jgi:stress response protein SCP2
MAVNLTKGQKVDLTKGNSSLKNVIVGLGWDEVEKKSMGFFASLMGNTTQDIDCDASAILISSNGKCISSQDIVFYNNLTHKSGSIVHQGDNLTGAGDGDDEQIKVSLADVPQNYERIVFVVTIYQAFERKQHFGLIKNAFIRIVDADTNKELCKYNLSDDLNYHNKTAMVFGELYRHNGEWKFGAIGEATNDGGITQMAKRFM